MLELWKRRFLYYFFRGGLLFRFVDLLRFLLHRKSAIYVVTQEKELPASVLCRINFYLQKQIQAGVEILLKNRISLRMLFSRNPVLLLDYSAAQPWLAKYRREIGRINDREDASAADQWHSLANAYSGFRIREGEEYCRFQKLMGQLLRQNMSKSYVIGTGPSAMEACSRNWDDGYVIVCNMIVKNEKLWHHLKPDIMVANDPIYHFGHNRIANVFRNDLRLRLQESPETILICPMLYYGIMLREFSDFRERMVFVPHNTRKIDIADGLLRDFSFPKYRNVLIHQQLPVACTLSSHIALWGFDGRAPNDRGFWKNSDQLSYSEYLPELYEDNPAFFACNVPKNDPAQYARRVFNQELPEVMALAELKGITFEMLHPSYTPVLAAHYHHTDYRCNNFRRK